MKNMAMTVLLDAFLFLMATRAAGVPGRDYG